MPTYFPVTAHTNYVGQGTTFVAIQGFKQSGSLFINEALEKGASTIVISQDESLCNATIAAIEKYKPHLIRVENTRKSLALLSAQAAGNPAQKLTIFGITGTKGKTTTSFILYHILKEAGYKVALLSTVKNIIQDTEFIAPLTTAQPDYIHQFLQLCISHSITHVVMEVAAQAVSLHRTFGIAFDGIIFTNFSREHLEFYTTLDDYFTAKCNLLSQTKKHCPIIINSDDKALKTLAYTHIPFGKETADIHPNKIIIQPQIIQPFLKGSLIFDNNEYELECSNIIGEYNFYNICAATSLALKIGISSADCIRAIKTFTGVPGRLEKYTLANGALCVIDYAHNPSSFETILSTLRELSPHLIVVFGAGGDRDPGRRPQMGSIAATYADQIIVTTDNPRSETVETIIEQIISGIDKPLLHKVCIEKDRAEAIKKAYKDSKKNSIIALLGKGGEQGQLVGTTQIPFCERSIVQSLQ